MTVEKTDAQTERNDGQKQNTSIESKIMTSVECGPPNDGMLADGQFPLS